MWGLLLGNKLASSVLLHGVSAEGVADEAAGTTGVELLATDGEVIPELGSVLGVAGQDISWDALVAAVVHSTPEAVGDSSSGVWSAGGAVASWVLVASAGQTFGNFANDLGVDAVEDCGLFAGASGGQSVALSAEPADGGLASGWLSVDEAWVSRWQQSSTTSEGGELSSVAERAAVGETIPLEAARNELLFLAVDGNREEEGDEKGLVHLVFFDTFCIFLMLFSAFPCLNTKISELKAIFFK